MTEFASDACATYQKKNTRLAIGLTGNGKQMDHNNPKRPEQACTIYCEQVSSLCTFDCQNWKDKIGFSKITLKPLEIESKWFKPKRKIH